MFSWQKIEGERGNMAINLSKGQKINLQKSSSSSGLGEILVNLNWISKPANQGVLKNLFGGGSSDTDLDL